MCVCRSQKVNDISTLFCELERYVFGFMVLLAVSNSSNLRSKGQIQRNIFNMFCFNIRKFERKQSSEMVVTSLCKTKVRVVTTSRIMTGYYAYSFQKEQSSFEKNRTAISMNTVLSMNGWKNKIVINYQL